MNLGADRDGLTAINGVDSCERREQRQHTMCFVHPIQAQSHIVHNRHAVFSTIDKMWKDVACVGITPKALQGTPNPGKRGEEPEQAGI